jgi:ribonuclease P protein component
MLPRSERLHTAQFGEVMKKGRIFQSPFFTVRAISGAADRRISAVVPKRIAPTAALRNNIRRRIYEEIRSFKDDIRTGTHAVVIAKSSVIEQLKTSDLKDIFVKARLLG